MTEEKTARQQFADHLQSHDWWFGMSDDYRYWSAGRASYDGLKDKHRRLAPPWTLGELRAWALGLTLDKYGPEEDGRCQCLDGRGVSMARSELITPAEADEITRWMEEG